MNTPRPSSPSPQPQPGQERPGTPAETKTAEGYALSLLQAAMESTADGILVVDKHRKIVLFNNRFAELWRIPQETLASRDDDLVLGLALAQVVEPEKFAAKVHELYQQDEVESFDTIEFKDGRFFERYSRPQRLDGQVVGRVWSFRDVTARRQTEFGLRESEERYRKLVEVSPDAIFINQQGRISFINAAGLRLLGATEPGQIIGKSIWEIFHPDCHEAIRRRIKRMFSGHENAPPIDEKVVRLDGNIADVEVVASPLDRQEEPAVQVVMHDISERKQAEEALRKSKALFESLFNNHAAVKLVIDPDSGRILDANPAAVNYYGWPKEQLLQMRIQEINTLSPEAVQHEMEKARLLQRTYFEFRHRRADGSVRDVAVFSSNIAVEGKDILHSIIHDITDQRQAEAELQRSESLLAKSQEIAHVGSWIYEAPTGQFSCSEEVYRIFGLPHQGQGISYADFLGAVHPDDRARVDAAYSGSQQAGQDEYETEYRIVRRGEIRWVHGKCVHERNPAGGTILRSIGMVQDITERRRTEVELQQHREHLEELVQQRTKELAEARDQAQAANRAKSAFLSNMSHELRTPLTAVLGFAELISRDQSISGRSQDNLNVIIRSGEHLLALINDILELAKIEDGRIGLDFHDVDLAELSRNVIDMMQGRAGAKALRLTLDPDSSFTPFVKTDPGKLRQILINLVGNAIKFTPSGKITIRMTTEAGLSGQTLTVEVRDTGIGISRENQRRLFHPFEQIGTSGSTEGTGLGLTITYQYVQILGGRIWVESEPGCGSCFRFTIPVGQIQNEIQEQNKDQKAIGIEGTTAKYRILIVEDQADNRLLFHYHLAPYGFQLREAVNGQEAIAAFQEWRPDLVFMDRRMPVMDGLEATRRIRSLPGGGTVPIVAVSAHSFKEEQQEMLAAGCNDFLGKPFSESDLLQVLKKSLCLELIYAAGDTPAPLLRPCEPGDLKGLPRESLEELNRLAIDGNDTELHRWLHSQASLAPETKKALAVLIRGYQFDKIETLVEPWLHS